MSDWNNNINRCFYTLSEESAMEEKTENQFKSETLYEKLKLELQLVLFLLSGWEEDVAGSPGVKVYSCYREIPFIVLDELEEREMIFYTGGSSTMYLTGKGKQEAERILQKILAIIK